MAKTAFKELEELIAKHKISYTVMDEKDFDAAKVQVPAGSRSVVIRFDDLENVTGCTVYE